MPMSGIGSRDLAAGDRRPCRASPAAGPATMRSRVDLPQPLGPTSETNSPAPTASEMPASASTGPLAA